MKLFSKRAIAAIIAILLLVSMAACRNLPSPLRTPSAGTTLTPSQGSENSPASQEQAGSFGEPGEPSAESPDIEPIAVRRVIIDPEFFDVARGSAIEPFVIILPADAADMSYTLSSGDESILRELGGLGLLSAQERLNLSQQRLTALPERRK